MPHTDTTTQTTRLGQSTDTICALATPTGGALAIVRISGPAALDIVTTICSSSNRGRKAIANAAANTIRYAHITAPDGTPIDDVMVSTFHAPHSYTGENSAEISTHGSRYIATKLIELLVQQGCRMARPGEFTQRAYLNGKLDLTQAEAVADIIASTNRATHQIAMAQLRGSVSTELSQLRNKLLKMTSLIELELDFSDHEDLQFADRTELLSLASNICRHIDRLAKTFETGQALRQGIPVAIVGKTNVGKSTLLNRLLKDDRAIVSDIHGTTRDTIEDTTTIDGIQFRFIDTAGLRHTTDCVEQAGIQRTHQAIEKARLILWVIDKQPSQKETADMTALAKGKHMLVVANKSDLHTSAADLPSPSTFKPPFLNISAKYDSDLSELESAIVKAAGIPAMNESDIIITNSRHYDALTRSLAPLHRVIDGLHHGLSSDLLSEDLHDTINILAEITGGQITPQETLNNIFKNFCVGK